MDEIKKFLEWMEHQSLIVGDPRIEGGRWEGNYDSLPADEVLRRYAEAVVS